MNEPRQLARNAKVILEVTVESIRHFRPKRGEKDPESAIITLSPTGEGPYFAKIYDERKNSTFISRALANLRTAEKTAKKYLDQDKVDKAKSEAHDGWPEFFGRNASIFLDYEESNTPGRKAPVLILRDPEESEEEGLLTAVTFDKCPGDVFAIRNLHDSWLRMVLDRDKVDGTSHFLLLTVTSERSPVNIFHRTIDGKKLVATDYILTSKRRIVRREAEIIEEEWLEGEPFPEVIASFEEEAPDAPSEENLADSPVDPNIAKAQAVQALKDLGVGKKRDRETLITLGVTSAETLLDQIRRTKPAKLATDTGIKIDAINAAVTKAKQHGAD